MTDHDLDQRLRAWYRADIDDRESAPHQLRADLAMLAQGDAGARQSLSVEWIPSVSRFAPFAALAAAALVVALVISIGLLLRSPNVGPPVPAPDPARPGASNGWIAYSTAPADYDRRPGYALGSDIYLVREGVAPRLIADREGGATWNVCPAFSPGGRMLAFGEETNTGRAIVIVGMNANGTTTDLNLHLPVAGTGNAPCPRWSSDGRRVAYVEGGSVVVLGLDGSTSAPAAGDPAITDFVRNSHSLRSPGGDLIARDEADGLVVRRADGSESWTVPLGNHYALGTWSPDGKEILYMRDVSGLDFTLFAVSVDEPYVRTTVVAFVHVNHGRSWPGNGDVSWQPVPRGY